MYTGHFLVPMKSVHSAVCGLYKWADVYSTGNQQHWGVVFKPQPALLKTSTISYSGWLQLTWVDGLVDKLNTFFQWLWNTYNFLLLSFHFHKKQVLLNSYCSCHRTGSPLEEFLPLWQRRPRWHFLSAPPRPSSSSSLAPLLLDKQKTIICAVKKLVHVIVMKSFSEWCFYLIISPPVFIRMSSLIEAKLPLTITWLLINYYQ